ncbi:RidA family protein [Saccharopolyspora spinosa]|uniref:Enamine deaminase RidA (YjgF/YER057c/UK114 family) n=1 Tax=Saccharopolyspora spinosa TaxID=60894 RepID=A0A2N3Y1B4_SACSN|nr:RidA family protein [Saccharopolyspora spinosa]PKW16680.1 enamine deaminase RidA (YjgF/YER057c/UK114 family) [Saccharopolyspora spinosa]
MRSWGSSFRSNARRSPTSCRGNSAATCSTCPDQGSKNEAGTVSAGTLGAECSIEQRSADARQVALQILASLRYALGSLDHVETIIKLLGMVQATADSTDHPKVIDGCSDLLIEIFGERGRHARSAVGMSSLPGGLTVEVEAIVQIKSDVQVRRFGRE